MKKTFSAHVRWGEGHPSTVVRERNAMQADKVISRCRQLAQFSEEPGQTKRTFLSPAMRDCMQAVQGWMEGAGMAVRTDAAGNLRGRYAGHFARGA